MKKILVICLFLTSLVGCKNNYENDFDQYWMEAADKALNQESKIDGVFYAINNGLLLEGVDTNQIDQGKEYFFLDYKTKKGNLIDGRVLFNITTSKMYFDRLTINDLTIETKNLSRKSLETLNISK